MATKTCEAISASSSAASPPLPTSTPPGDSVTLTTEPGCTPARRSVYISWASVWIGSPIRRTTTVLPSLPGASSDRLTMPSSRNGSASAFSPSSSSPGIGFPYGDSVGWRSSSSTRRSTASLITCSQRQASACTCSHSSPMTSTSRHSARRCLRITRVASLRPSSVSSRCRSLATATRPSRSMRATVWLTVGPLRSSRSAIRARMGTTPSSSSSRMVRRYISVVSISPDIRAPRIACATRPNSTHRADNRPAPSVRHVRDISREALRYSPGTARARVPGLRSAD
uniref:Putative sporulation protein n=1 Tax=Kitasatospora aureofaciens TaxID=1894 RepID=O33584_KITAU|nr:putative sporulation protein [Streptomyces lavendulae subsp. lavendulae]